MQTPQKQKRPKVSQKRSSNKRVSARSQSVKTVLLMHPGLRHLRLVEHKHTGKLIHHRHTSHLVLLAILILVGIFLYASQSIAQAQQITGQGNVTIGLIVPGPPPTIGATITSPKDGATLLTNTVNVSGSCDNGTLVVIYDNGQSAGSTACTDAGIFSLSIQLLNGGNALQALNYDSLNQAGPATPTVTVTVSGLEPATASPQPAANLVSPEIIPILPTATKKTCNEDPNDTVAKAGGTLTVQVACIIRDVNPLAPFVLGLFIQGGQPPYAINVSWGARINNTLISVPNPGYTTVDAAYPIPGEFTINVTAKDAAANSATTQAVAEINGKPPAVSPLTIIQNDVLKTSWFQTPVPLYLVAVVLTLGFWFGDLFNRYFSLNRPRRQKRRIS